MPRKHASFATRLRSASKLCAQSTGVGASCHPYSWPLAAAHVWTIAAQGCDVDLEARRCRLKLWSTVLDRAQFN